MRYWYRQRKPYSAIPAGWVAAKYFSLYVEMHEAVNEKTVMVLT